MSSRRCAHGARQHDGQGRPQKKPLCVARSKCRRHTPTSRNRYHGRSSHHKHMWSSGGYIEASALVKTPARETVDKCHTPLHSVHNALRGDVVSTTRVTYSPADLVPVSPRAYYPHSPHLVEILEHPGRYPAAALHTRDLHPTR